MFGGCPCNQGDIPIEMGDLPLMNGDIPVRYGTGISPVYYGDIPQPLISVETSLTGTSLGTRDIPLRSWGTSPS